ncbi:MAG: hypothetical protein Q9M37_00775 [Desulfonauticus sp.]|nr:hypothetical protein [Desulfonauticus sp.]
MDQALVINDIDDFVKILRQYPEWKEKVREIILTEELMRLPSKFDNFVEQDFKPLKKKVDKIEQDVEVLKEDVEVLKEDVRVLKEDVANLKKDMKGVKNDIGSLKGQMLELMVRDKAGAYFGRVLKKVRVLNFSDLADWLYDALDAGVISEEEKDDALRVDLVVKGILRKNNKLEVYLAVEISEVVDKRDVERALKRAEVIEKTVIFSRGQETQKKCLAAVIGNKYSQGAKKLIQEHNIIAV